MATVAQSIPPVKGTRDFFPEDFAILRWLTETWRNTSRRHGFVEFDGPTLEHLELYTRKSGDEIVEQLFHLTDRGGRDLALRPEMTPTLARMVAARLGSLPRPLKWFCIPRMFRGERPQRGRLREFVQWNIDILGTDSPTADAECILVAVDALRALGLTRDDFAVHVSDRRLVAAILAALGVTSEAIPAAFDLLDKAERLPGDELARRWGESLGTRVDFARVWDALAMPDPAALRGELSKSADAAAVDPVLARFTAVLGAIQDFGITEFCKFDLRVVRGLAYYTGVVFEAYDRPREFRAILGGGRYDDLLAMFGGKPLPAVGFGMGDAVLLELLASRQLTRAVGLEPPEVFVIEAPAETGVAGQGGTVRRILATLRRAGIAAEAGYEVQAVAKQMKRAAERGVGHVIFVGDETHSRGVVAVKNMKSGEQRDVAVDALLADPAGVIGGAGGV